jgi:hypothetical protein
MRHEDPPSVIEQLFTGVACAVIVLIIVFAIHWLFK